MNNDYLLLSVPAPITWFVVASGSENRVNFTAAIEDLRCTVKKFRLRLILSGTKTIKQTVNTLRSWLRFYVAKMPNELFSFVASFHIWKTSCLCPRLFLVLGQKGRGQNGTNKMAPIESSINQAIQLPLTIWFSSLIPLPLRPI